MHPRALAGVLSLLVLVTYAQPGLKIISQRTNLYTNGVTVIANNTIEVECGDGDFGVYRYATISQSGGNTIQLGVLCSPPVWTYTLTPQGYIARDARVDTLTNCMAQDSGSLSGDEAHALIDRTTTGVTLNNLRRKRQLMHLHGRRGHRKILWATVGVSLVAGFFAGMAGGAAYCAAAGCVLKGEFNALEKRVTTLQDTAANLGTALDEFKGTFQTYTDLQSQLAGVNNDRFETIESLTANSVNNTQTQLQYAESNVAFLNSLTQNLTNDISNIQIRAATTDANLAQMGQDLAAGISGVSAALADYIARQNNATLNVTTRLSDLSIILNRNLQTLNSKVTDGFSTLQSQLLVMHDNIINTQPRRALAAWSQQKLLDIDAIGFTPFTPDTGTAPRDDSDPAVWRTLMETHRVLYVRNNLGLTAQQLDISYFCTTTAVIDYIQPMKSASDFFLGMGPVGCNTSIPQSCRCWIKTQRSSCTTNSTWVAQNTIWRNVTGGIVLNGTYGICTAAVSVQAAVTHTTFSTFLDLLGTICGEGTYVSDPTYRVMSGQLSRGSNMPYNPTVCGAGLDVIIDVPTTGNSFINAIIGYMGLAFTVVRESANYYSTFVYGQAPSGLTTVEDPLIVLNGVNARCLFTGMTSYDLDGGLLPVYRMDFVSATSSVTVKLDGVVSDVVTQVSVSVPSSIVLPGASTAVVGDPSDTSEIWNAPESELPLSPVARAREDHLTYPIAPDEASFNVTAWQTRSNVQFNHFAGAATAAYYHRDINGTGQCTGTSLPGEGDWCIIRNNFAISPAVGGVTLTPLTGTGAIGRALLTSPDGAVMSVIFSDCPGVALAQNSPNVATLTLSNPRPDNDITVAIV